MRRNVHWTLNSSRWFVFFPCNCFWIGYREKISWACVYRIFGYFKVYKRYDRRATGESLDHRQLGRVVSNVRLHDYLRKQWRSQNWAKRISILEHQSSKRALGYSSFKVSRKQKKTQIISCLLIFWWPMIFALVIFFNYWFPNFELLSKNKKKKMRKTITYFVLDSA